MTPYRWRNATSSPSSPGSASRTPRCGHPRRCPGRPRARRTRHPRQPHRDTRARRRRHPDQPPRRRRRHPRPARRTRPRGATGADATVRGHGAPRSDRRDRRDWPHRCRLHRPRATGRPAPHPQGRRATPARPAPRAQPADRAHRPDGPQASRGSRGRRAPRASRGSRGQQASRRASSATGPGQARQPATRARTFPLEHHQPDRGDSVEHRHLRRRQPRRDDRLASLPAGNKLYLQEYDNAANWQDWPVTSVTPASGYTPSLSPSWLRSHRHNRLRQRPPARAPRHAAGSDRAARSDGAAGPGADGRHRPQGIPGAATARSSSSPRPNTTRSRHQTPETLYVIIG